MLQTAWYVRVSCFFFESPCCWPCRWKDFPLTFCLSISAEFLGFNNKTCDAGVPPMSQTYGNTVGPLIRQASGDSKLWRWWEVKMTSKVSSTGAPMATIKNIFPSNKGKPKCLGHYITDYYHYKNKEACTELPWAERVHLHAESRPWEFQAVPGTDCFNIIDDAKPDGCLKFLSASASCSEQYVHLAAGDDGSGLQRWRLVGYKGPPPSPPAKSPPAPKSPPRSPVKSPPPPKAKAVAPQLISVSASSPTTGSVVFQPTAGASSCNVTVSKDGQAATRTITSLNYPFTNFYAVGLASDTDYTVKVLCQLPGGATLPAPGDGTLHTPPNSGHPAVINVVPTSSTSGNITIVPPDAVVCKAKLYEVKATPKAGGATQTFTSTSLNVALTGLTSGVQYSIIVDAICDDGSTTKPSDPIYFTPLKSTTPLSSPPPPLAKPSPPSSPGSKAPPPAAKSPPPPKRAECNEAPTIQTAGVVGSTITFGVKPPSQVQGTTSSELSYVAECTYTNGNVTEEGGNWIPVTVPNTAFQMHVSKAATCDLLIFVRQIGQDIPVYCEINAVYFTIQDQDTTPGISPLGGPTTTSPPTIQIVKPQIGCDNMSFAVSSGGNVVANVSSAAISQPVQLIGLPPSSAVNVTVTGVCPDGSKTPTSTPVTVSTQCANGTSYISTTGLCVTVFPPPPPNPPPSPPPSPPPPPISPITVKATYPAVWHIDIYGGDVRSVHPIQIKNNTGGTLFPPGCYSMSYVSGCMQYGVPMGDPLAWRLNAAFPDHGWYFGAKPDLTDPTLCKSSTCGGRWDIHCATSCLPKIATGTPLPGPSTSNVSMTLAQCEQWNTNSAPTQYTITGAPSEIFVWLRDQDATRTLGEEANDNSMFIGQEPTWVLKSCSVLPPP
jgi:hypothetical protein